MKRISSISSSEESGNVKNGGGGNNVEKQHFWFKGRGTHVCNQEYLLQGCICLGKNQQRWRGVVLSCEK